MRSGAITMTDDEKELFIAGVRVEMARRNGMSQKDFSKLCGITSVSLSRFFKTKPAKETAKQRKSRLPNDESISKICDALGREEDELIEYGKPPARKRASLPSDFMSYDEMINVTREIQDSYKKINDRLIFWRAIFENMPIASLVIRDKEVVRQNKKSRDLGIVTGGALCEKCISSGTPDCSNDNCAVRRAMETGVETSETKMVDKTLYKLEVFPLIQNAHEYFIVIATEINECLDYINGKERRHEPNRREDEQ